MRQINVPVGRAGELERPIPTVPSPKDDFGGPCPLCQLSGWSYLFISHGASVYQCGHCGLIRLYPQPKRSDVLTFYADGNGRDPFTEDARLTLSRTEQEAAESYLALLSRGQGPTSNLLLIAPRGHPFGLIAERKGYRVETCLDAEEMERVQLPKGHYPSAALIFALEKAVDPIAMLTRVHDALRPHGKLLLVTPAADSWPNQQPDGRAAIAITGQRFETTSVIYFGDEPLETAYASPEFLTAFIPDWFLSSPGEIDVYVVNRNRFRSNTLTLTIAPGQ